ncbi:LytR/AlgR family response regulator transcription factor [Sphingobacterium faecium]|jgi:DNA-binding LytR/AlgR family response regulator|uniref:LytR/AlgR family response regulator transcription factor n=1 Tax=Sphingobacterium faecium TaxID=34087 RepID=UPI0004E5F5E9|nr:LytTR family DNA-binding domain-containing protein [Sphingobacterium faecium]WGQ14220.1 LytTR family DNA-binding domain-containing protein [Sphingobacterium faecium]CDS93339.1 Two component transcriptional regulator, LytTR family [Sphingobacterium sp. PM2-P1-29]SJN51730.1 Two-component system response regulator [Sphingobacterium faecium PCAi_F2.5]
MKIKCILIDDEPFALNILEDDLLSFDNIEILQKFNAPNDVSDFLKDQPVDLIFLDIQMPEKLGTEFIRELPAPPLFIFTTAYHDYAVEGFELNAVDYLLKPISKGRLTTAIRKVEEIMLRRDKPKIDHIVVNVEYKKTKIFLHEISYIEGLKDYVKIYLVSRSNPLLTRSNLRGMEKILPETDFLRIHNSFIINKSRIEHVTQTKLTLPEIALPIGKKYISNIDRFHLR